MNILILTRLKKFECFFILSKTKPLIIKICSWPCIDEYEGLVLKKI